MQLLLWNPAICMSTYVLGTLVDPSLRVTLVLCQNEAVSLPGNIRR